VGTAGRGTQRRAVFIAIAVTIGLLALTILSSSASTPAPVLTVTKTDVGYKVAWKYSSSEAPQNLELEIDRGADPGHFTEWARVRSPEQSAWRYDRSPLAGPSYYRARLWVRGAAAGWSDIVGVNVPPTTTTRSTTTTSTTATSTTTTTVKPTTTTRPTSTTIFGQGTTSTTRATTTTTTPKPTTTTTVKPPDACTTARDDVQREVNMVRAWFHVPLLHQHLNLDRAAYAHVLYMNSVGSVSHGPGGNPPLWVKEIIDYGYTPYSKLGQNLGGGMNNAHDLVGAWVGSLPHLTTMIDPDFSQMGAGCYHNTSGTGWPWYWAADFGRP
jgi:uncharacterized protein YkwD